MVALRPFVGIFGFGETFYQERRGFLSALFVYCISPQTGALLGTWFNGKTRYPAGFHG
jgi:hypothetical protein